MSGFAGAGPSSYPLTEADIASSGDTRYVKTTGGQALTLAQQAAVRSVLGVTKKNYIVNGGMQVSQENGATFSAISSYYPADQWLWQYSSGSIAAQQVASPTPGGSPNRVRLTVNTAVASPATTDFCLLQQRLEGSRIADLKWGTANAKTVTLQFGVKAPAGTYSVAILNQTGSRNYIAPFTIAAAQANTDVVISVTIPGDTSGTWATDNGIGMFLNWVPMVGSNFQAASANVWQASNLYAQTGQTNFEASVGNVFELFDVGLYEGTVAPAFQLPDYASELLVCQRYWEATYSPGTIPGTVTTIGLMQYTVLNPSSSLAVVQTFTWKVTKRSTPTVTPYSPATGASGKIRDSSNIADIVPSIDSIGLNGARLVMAPSAATANYNFQSHLTYNARM